MAVTQIAWGDPKAVKRWAPKLHRDVNADGYFSRKFVGKTSNSICQEKTELEKDAGDTISFDLEARLKGGLVEGDATAAGNESMLKHYTDTITIDQARKPVACGGRMSRQRTEHNLRESASIQLKNYWQQVFDELYFMYLSGDRGTDHSDIFPLEYTGRANNALRAPSASHHLFGGNATSIATLDATDKMDVNLIERADVRAGNMTKNFPNAVNMYPMMVDGEERYVMIMSLIQAFDLRTGAGTGNWLDINKALMTHSGTASPVVKGGLGMINNTILHAHRNVIGRSDAGVGNNVAMAEALFCARQALAVAYAATDDGRRMSWVEDMTDYKNNPVIAGGYIFGMSKCRFNGGDFGVMRLDTAAANPN